MKRRNVLKASVAYGLSAWSNAIFGTEMTNEMQYLGSPLPFDYAWLKGLARSKSEGPIKESGSTLPVEIKAMNWDQFQSIKYRDDRALWRGNNLPFQVKFFHLGLYFNKPVRIYELKEGMARELAYDSALFDFGKSGLHGDKLPKTLGFAGFRVNYHTDLVRDITAFLGASYFRAVGAEWQYGLSARGLAINSGLSTPEEFPLFSAFWLQRPAVEDNSLVVYALLESASVTGAYRFEIRPGATLTMDVDVALYPRKTIEHVGIAPLTSMFRCGENDCRERDDWRQTIHDSDGLSMWLGNGERIWRPLTDPVNVRLNSYFDENPRGFGLLQRDRNFDHYQDDGAFYNRRPSLWVEPKSSWGKGAVQLVELPTKDETSDNIVAFWHPELPIKPGQEVLFSYRLHWGENLPFNKHLATVNATRTGQGGVLGQRRTHFSWRFVIDFSGGDLSLIGKNNQPQAKLNVSRGQLELVSVRPLESIEGYRVMFDLVPDADNAPIDMRLYLDLDGQALTETWMYQWTPPAQRAF